MARRRSSGAERYHDRVAGIYDQMYDGSRYWEFYWTVTWRHLKRVLPTHRPARVLDVGCGTGRWGLRLLKSGYEVDFLDLSQKMLDQVALRLDRDPPPYAPQLIHATIDDLGLLPAQGYDAMVGQGDPLSCAQHPPRALAEMTRLLRPGGVMVQSVDNRCAGYDHFLEQDDLAGLERFARDGRAEWLAEREEERFPLTMFTPAGLRKLFTGQGYEVLSLIGKTVLPIRELDRRRKRGAELLADRRGFDRLLRLEEQLHAEEAMLGRAAHLEIAARLSTTPGT